MLKISKYFDNGFSTKNDCLMQLLGISMVVVLLGFTLFLLFTKGGLGIIRYDEITYNLEARSFIETGNLKAVIMSQEKGSFLGQYGWYGPLNTILYGGVMILFQLPISYYTVVNFLFLLIGLLVITKFTSGKSKGLILLFILFSSPVLYFGSQYLPVGLFVLLSVLLSILSFKLFSNPSNYKIMCFLALLLFAIVARVNFVFYSFPLLLIPFKFRKFWYSIVLFCGSFLFSLWVYKYLYAPPALSQVQMLSEADSSFISLMIEYTSVLFQKNTTQFLESISISQYHWYWIILLICIPFYGLFHFCKSWKSINISHSLWLTISAFMLTSVLFYVWDIYFFSRLSLVLVGSVAFYLVNLKQKKLLIILTFIFALHAPILLRRTVLDLDLKSKLFQTPSTKISTGFIPSNSTEEVVFLIDECSELPEKLDYINDLICLPLQFENGLKIRYSSNFFTNECFELHGRVPISGIMTLNKDLGVSGFHEPTPFKGGGSYYVSLKE